MSQVLFCSIIYTRKTYRICDFTLYLTELTLDNEASRNTFNQVMSLWIIPEIELRNQSGTLDPGFTMERAQILLNPEKDAPEIRLNEEVKAIVVTRLKPDIRKMIEGEPIYQHEIENILKVELTNTDNPYSAHVTLLRFRNGWVIHFDFRYNKPKAKERFDAAKEFYEIARLSYENKLWRPFVDTLFSATELLVTSQLFVMSEPDYPKHAKHKNIQYRYNSFIKIGNPKLEYVETYNKLSRLRDNGRYLNNPFNLDIQKAKEFLETIKEMIKYTEKFIQ